MKKLMNNKILKAVMSVVLCVAVFFGSFVNTSVYVYAAPVVGVILKAVGVYVGTYLVDRFADYVWDGMCENAAALSDFPKESVLIELPKDCLAILVSWRDMCKAAGFEPYSDELYQFITDMRVEAPDYTYYSETYGENYGEMHSFLYDNLMKLENDYCLTVNHVYEFVSYYMNNNSVFFSDGAVKIVASTFKEAVEESNTKYTPKNATGKMSYRTDTRFHNKYDSAGTQAYCYLDFYSATVGGFTALGGGDEMYAVFFYKTDTEEYCSQYQFHFTVTTTEHWYSDRDEVEYYGYNLDLAYWDMINGSESEATTLNILTDVTAEYFDLWLVNYQRYGFRTCGKYLDYVNFSSLDSSRIIDERGKLVNLGTLLNSSDVVTSLLLENLTDHFKGSLKTHDTTCEFGGCCDLGYYASTTPISTDYGLDVNRIPDNYYITTSGDTIYNYTITNPETGQSDSITNYVTNNYTYITAPDIGNGNSGTGGTLNGEITVGGNVNVGGQVDVNVNVNVNGSEGGGSDINVDDYINTDGTDVDVNDVIGKLPQLSKGFTDYLKGFIAWLPAELYGLVLLVLVASVFNAFRRR